MPYVRCSNGGGAMSETSLWTNANPTSAMAQGATLSLSQNYSNFDYITDNI